MYELMGWLISGTSLTFSMNILLISLGCLKITFNLHELVINKVKCTTPTIYL